MKGAGPVCIHGGPSEVEATLSGESELCLLPPEFCRHQTTKTGGAQGLHQVSARGCLRVPPGPFPGLPVTGV